MKKTVFFLFTMKKSWLTVKKTGSFLFVVKKTGGFYVRGEQNRFCGEKNRFRGEKNSFFEAQKQHRN